MSARRSLKLPITLGTVMIVLLVLLTVGWVLLTLYGAAENRETAAVYWALLSIGTLLLVSVLVGVCFYLALSIRSINFNRRQSNFIDSVTHELKSPIASLKLYLQTLTRHQLSPAEQAEFFQMMLEDIDRLDHLINHVLDAGRLEKQPAEHEMEDVDLIGVLTECGEIVCQRYRVPREVVQLELTPCILRSRRGELDVLFRNLIDNAVKYAGDPPKVSITSRLNVDGQVRVQIADNGRGVPLNMRGKIFGRFVRLGSELEREKPGTGLGLYIVAELVKRLRGKITVQNPAQGTGAVFEVILSGVIKTKPASGTMPATNPAEVA